MKHKEGCRMAALNIALTAWDPTGPDRSLQITEEGITYSANIHTANEDDWEITFNYCPVCGIKLSKPNAGMNLRESE